jgi:hypothetical protein
MSFANDQFNNPYNQQMPPGKPQPPLGGPPRKSGPGAGVVIAIVAVVLLLGGCMLGGVGVVAAVIFARVSYERDQAAYEIRQEYYTPPPTTRPADEPYPWEETIRQQQEEMRRNREAMRDEALDRFQENFPDSPPAFPPPSFPPSESPSSEFPSEAPPSTFPSFEAPR